MCPSGYTPLSKNEEVRRCVHKIADLVSSMTIMLMENGDNGDVRLKNGLSKKIDINPNKNMTRKNFIYKIVTDMLLTGNSVVLPIIKNGLIDDLKILESDSVVFRKTNDSYQIYYQGKIFEPDEVLHFVLNPDDDNPYKGQGLAPTIKETVANLLQANATKTGFLKSKWRPSLIMSINSDAEELQDETRRADILGSYTKTTEIGEPWLIPAGEISIEKIQPLTLKDLAIQESITLDKQALATSIGVPPFMVGVGSFSKDEFNNFIGTTIMSNGIILQQELTKKLPHSDDWHFKLSPKSLMQYSLNEKMEFVEGMVKIGMLNRNEGRDEFDYAPVDKDGMNDYIVLENFIPVDKVGAQKKLKGGEKAE